MKDTYIYPAVFDYSDGNGISIFFPDLPGCLPCADTTEEAVKYAREALYSCIYSEWRRTARIFPALLPSET